MKKYSIFYYDTYYPSGGYQDYVGSFDSLDDAQEFIDLINTKVIDRILRGYGDVEIVNHEDNTILRLDSNSIYNKLSQEHFKSIESERDLIKELTE